MTEGKIKRGYEGRRCAIDTCQLPLTEMTGAFLHKNRHTEKLFMVCEECSIQLDLNHPLSYPRVNL